MIDLPPKIYRLDFWIDRDPYPGAIFPLFRQCVLGIKYEPKELRMYIEEIFIRYRPSGEEYSTTFWY